MVRTIISVTPAARGWRVECPENGEHEMEEMHQALSTAWNLARDLHVSTGFPTAVNVRVGCGDGVMMAYHG